MGLVVLVLLLMGQLGPLIGVNFRPVLTASVAGGCYSASTGTCGSFERHPWLGIEFQPGHCGPGHYAHPLPWVVPHSDFVGFPCSIVTGRPPAFLFQLS